MDETGLSIVIPPRSEVTSSELSARSDLKHAGVLTDLLKAGFGLLDLDTTVSLSVQDFAVVVPYVQLQVPAYLT